MTGASLEPYQRRLFALLALATFFEGFDTMLASLMLPQLGREFGADSEQLFDTLATLGLGAVLGFVPLRFADRFGRRPLLLVSIGGYAVLCLATAATRTLGEFTVCQFFARMFMVTELALAYLVLSEEMPSERRGSLNGMLGAFASVGAIVPAVLLPLSIQLGLGWRALYLLGGALIVLLPLYVTGIRETDIYQHLPRRTPADRWRELRTLFGTRHRRRFVAAVLVWLSIDFWNSCAMFSFSYYAQTERDWSPGDLALWMPIGGVFQFLGYIAAGRMMDRLGRRPTVFLYLSLASAASALCYLAEAKPLVVIGYFAMVSAGGMWAVAQTISAELFPTEIRATASGITHNLLGRLGMTLGPKSVGMLAASLGSTGDAVALLGALNLLAIPAIAAALPETRATKLSAQ